MKRQQNGAVKMVLRQYTAAYKKYKWDAIPAMLLPGIGSIFIFYVTPLVVARIITDFSNRTITLEALVPYLLAFGGVMLLGELLWRVAFIFLARLESKSIRMLYNHAMQELIYRDISFFHDNFAGSLTKKTIGFARNFEPFTDTITFSVFSSIIPVAFASFVLWQYSPWLVLGLLGMILLILSIIAPLVVKRQKLVKIREVASNAMAGHIADIIGNIDAVQAYANEKTELKTHKSFVADYITKVKKSWDFQNKNIDFTISPLYVITNTIGLGLAVLLSKNGANLAQVFVVFSYYATTTRILWEFNRIYRNLESSITDASQFTELLIESPLAPRSHSNKNLHANKGAIAFTNVNFSYAEDDHALFKDLNLDITAGEKIALVGKSGSGKTTITKLLLRFKEIDSGILTIDNQDISRVTLKSLREAIAFVPQDPVMFHRTIRDNISYGKLGATESDIIDAAKKANAYEFISSLPDGLDTFVGERGVKLSGGQRQRIAIARAMIKDAPILLLDEATSALDSESEKAIQDALWKLMDGKTAIVIAHRLSTIQRMDRIIVIENGTIIEQGSHANLLRHNGIYSSLWRHQSGGFISEESS